MTKSIGEKSKFKILVVGDLMLDINYSGDSLRLSPEAPVPVVENIFDSCFLGGAGNVAVNMSELGHEVSICGSVGSDENGRTILKHLGKNNILSDLVCVKDVASITKIRILANGKHVCRLDFEDNKDLYSLNRFSISKLIEPFDLIILSDYSKGVITQGLVNEVIDNALMRQIRVLVDPKPKNKIAYSNAYLIKPNMIEAKEMCAKYSLTNVSDLGAQIIKDYGCRNLIITDAQNGAFLFNGENPMIHFPALSKLDVLDVTGAGDTFISVIAHLLLFGATVASSVPLAVKAASFVCSKKGTTPITLEEFKSLGDA